MGKKKARGKKKTKSTKEVGQQCVKCHVRSALMNRGPVAQLVEQRCALREVVSSTLAGPTLRVLKITEEKVLPL